MGRAVHRDEGHHIQDQGEGRQHIEREDSRGQLSASCRCWSTWRTSSSTAPAALTTSRSSGPSRTSACQHSSSMQQGSNPFKCRYHNHPKCDFRIPVGFVHGANGGRMREAIFEAVKREMLVKKGECERQAIELEKAVPF